MQLEYSRSPQRLRAGVGRCTTEKRGPNARRLFDAGKRKDWHSCPQYIGARGVPAVDVCVELKHCERLDLRAHCLLQRIQRSVGRYRHPGLHKGSIITNCDASDDTPSDVLPDQRDSSKRFDPRRLHKLNPKLSRATM
jgi:hypothetical protein